MNFDLFYSDKKPTKFNQREKEKIMELLFKIKSNPDKLIEYFIEENKKFIFGKYSDSILNFHVKNGVLYIAVESKIIFQEIQFIFDEINNKLKLHTKHKIKSIKEKKL